MTTAQTQRHSVPELAAATARLAREQGRDALAKDIDRAVTTLERGNVTLAVVGEFKRGKSSLINALIDEPDLLPVDTTVTTSVVTTLSYADTERVTVLTAPPDGGDPEAVTIARADIADYVTESANPGNVRRAQLVTVELPSGRLRRGLVIADTPGVGGVEREHAAVTFSFLISADVVLFVLDALTPLSAEELDFIKNVHEQSQALLLAVTKIDREPDYETIVANTRAKLANVLGEDARSIPIVPISSLARLDFLESGEDEDLAASNFPAFEDALWNLLEARGVAAMIVRTLGVVVRAADELLAPLQSELDAYGDRSQPELDEQERRLTADAGRIDAMRRANDPWRQVLAAETARERATTETNLDARERTVRWELTAALDDDRVLADPALAVGRVDEAIARLAYELSGHIENRAGLVGERLASATGISVNPVSRDFSLRVEATAPTLSTKRPTGGVGSKVLRGAAALPQGVSIGGTAGYIVAALLSTNPVGWVVLGAALGTASIVRGEARSVDWEDREAGRTQLEQVMSRYIDECTSQVRAGVDWALGRVEEELAAEMDRALEQEHRRLVDSAAALADGRRRTGEEAAARTAELRGPVAELARLRADALALARSVTGGSSATRSAIDQPKANGEQG